MRLLACALLLIAACTREREVKLLFGPDGMSLTRGFRCLEDADPTDPTPNQPLFSHAVVDGQLTFSVVVDTVSLGDRFPGCRGEEIVESCVDSGCHVLWPMRDGVKRYCESISIPLTGDEGAVLDALVAKFSGATITTDAPSYPILFRGVATTQTCEEVLQAPDDVYVPLDPDLALGCAYTCPVLVDQITGPISMGFDALDYQCEEQVRACTSFLRR